RKERSNVGVPHRDIRRAARRQQPVVADLRTFDHASVTVRRADRRTSVMNTRPDICRAHPRFDLRTGTVADIETLSEIDLDACELFVSAGLDVDLPGEFS